MISVAGKRVWVTRTAPENERTAAMLAGIGYSALCVPVIEVQPLETGNIGGQPDAIVFTSPNGARLHPREHAARDVPVFAVGDRTARVAREAGYRRVASADGDVNDLGCLIACSLRRGSEVLCYGAETSAGDLVGDLRRHRFRVTAVPVYRTVSRAIEAITGELPSIGSVGMTLVHSPRAGRVVRQCLDDAHSRFRGAIHCISAAAAAPFADVADLRVEVAARPNERSLLATLPDLTPRM